jgi:hypothetical protein
MMIEGGEDTDGAGSGSVVEDRDASGARAKHRHDAGSIEGADTDGAGSKGIVKKNDPTEREFNAPD